MYVVYPKLSLSLCSITLVCFYNSEDEEELRHETDFANALYFSGGIVENTNDDEVWENRTILLSLLSLLLTDNKGFQQKLTNLNS